jgi:two-component system, response regulator YesN
LSVKIEYQGELQMLKAIVVDDEPKMREGFKKIIPWEQHGFTLCGDAENGRLALEVIEREKPALVITDIRMPVLSGLDLMMEVSGRIDCHFIVVSGYSEFQYAQRALVYGAVDYLLKPIDEEQLIAALKRTRQRVAPASPVHLPENPAQTKGAVEEVKRYIEEHYCEPVTIKEIAGKVFLHPIYLGQLFKKQTGMYFNDYVHKTRIEEAKKRLKDSSNKIVDIALSVGYNDTDYFVQKFKKNVSCTPSQFREKNNS